MAPWFVAMWVTTTVGTGDRVKKKQRAPHPTFATNLPKVGRELCSVPDYQKVNCRPSGMRFVKNHSRCAAMANQRNLSCCFDESPTDLRVPVCYVSSPQPSARHCHSLDEACSSDSSACSACGARSEVVPNVLHYVRVGSGCPDWISILSLVTARAHQLPDAVHLWTDEEYDCDHSGTEVTVGRCLEAFGTSQRRLPPWQAYARRAKREITQPAHRSDLARLHILNTHGGIYADQDVLFMNHLNQWRRCPFAIGTDAGLPKLNNGLMLATKRSEFGALWWHNLSYHFTSSSMGWDTHSCVWPFILCKAHPSLIAATSRLGTIPGPRITNGDGERLFKEDYATIEAFLQKERDAFHLTGYKEHWLEHTDGIPMADLDKIRHIPPRLEHQKPARDRLRWMMEIAIRHALRALPALDTLQQTCVEQAAARVLPSPYKMALFEGNAHWMSRVKDGVEK